MSLGVDDGGSSGRTMAARDLRGRTDECTLLDTLLDAIRRAEGQSLVVRGEAGIGKTALLEYLVRSASDMTVLRAVGVESEVELAYAGLHQVSASLLDRLDRLPTPQRQALEVAYGLDVGGAPDRFLVGLAVLSLLSEAADERPILCVVDDAQWLDRASALTLAFVARRLLAERVGVVFAARVPGAELAHLPELKIRGLPKGDARALLGANAWLKLDDRVRDRIVDARATPLTRSSRASGTNTRSRRPNRLTQAVSASRQTVFRRITAIAPPAAQSRRFP